MGSNTLTEETARTPTAVAVGRIVCTFPTPVFDPQAKRFCSHSVSIQHPRQPNVLPWTGCPSVSPEAGATVPIGAVGNHRQLKRVRHAGVGADRHRTPSTARAMPWSTGRVGTHRPSATERDRATAHDSGRSGGRNPTGRCGSVAVRGEAHDFSRG